MCWSVSTITPSLVMEVLLTATVSSVVTTSVLLVDAQAPVRRRAAKPAATRELFISFFIMCLTPEFSSVGPRRVAAAERRAKQVPTYLKQAVTSYDGGVSERPVYSVSELIRQLNLDLYRYNDIAVEGEVTNFVRSAAGHLYFSLKDAKAQMKVVFFVSAARFLKFRIENGLQLTIVRGRLTIYEAKGEFQLNAVRPSRPGSGAAARVRAAQETAGRGGAVDPARKKPIPMLPQRIAG